MNVGNATKVSKVSTNLPELVGATLVAGALVLACSGDPFAPIARDAPRAYAERVDAGDDASAGDGVDVSPAHAGVPSEGRDPAVVAIDANGEGLCSGVLVGSGVVLTARHCVSKAVEAVACPTGEAQVLHDRVPSSLRVYVGDDVATARLAARGAELVVPPSRVLCDADVAAIVLDEPIEGVVPLPVRERGAAKGERLRAVGFGSAARGGIGGAGGTRAAVKLVREHVRVTQSRDAEFLVAEASCKGDSGGPALDETTGAVVGVASRGGPACQGEDAHNVYTRLDAFRALVEEALERARLRRTRVLDDAGAPTDETRDAGKEKPAPKPDKPASDVGAPCDAAEDCASGVCVREGERRYCSRACGPGDRCPSGFHCKASNPSEGGATSICRMR